MKNNKPKIALVYDRVNKYGGAERVLEALHRIWPDAPLYTSVYEKNRAGWASCFKINTTFLQKIRIIRNYHEYVPFLMPLAFENLNFDGFDIVISVTSAEAKDLITKPETLHVCYCLTPTRYLWSGKDNYLKQPGLGAISPIAGFVFSKMLPILRKWDLIYKNRPDKYIAISETVASRISEFYKIIPDLVINPPVLIDKTKDILQSPNNEKGYYLTISRFVSYKRFDLLIDAFNLMGKPLVVIGSGRDEIRIKKTARKNVRIITKNLTDSEIVNYYKNCCSFVYAGEEDFGLVAAESLMLGKPVICYALGGMAEIVKDGITGLKFTSQTVSAIISAVMKFENMKFDEKLLKQEGEKYSFKNFKKKFVSYIYSVWQNHQEEML